MVHISLLLLLACVLLELDQLDHRIDDRYVSILFDLVIDLIACIVYVQAAEVQLEVHKDECRRDVICGGDDMSYFAGQDFSNVDSFLQVVQRGYLVLDLCLSLGLGLQRNGD